LDPSLAGAHNNLAFDLWRSGRIREAMEHYQRALELKPDLYEAELNFAKLLSSVDPNRAIPHAERACIISGRRNLECMGMLSDLYARAGRFADAVRTAEEARNLARAGGRIDLASQYEDRIRQYRAQQPRP